MTSPLGEKERDTRTGNSGDETLFCLDLYSDVSSMSNANKADARLTPILPNNEIACPITFTVPILSKLLSIRSVAFTAAPQKPLPVIAI
jgi:hypothetical protein